MNTNVTNGLEGFEEFADTAAHTPERGTWGAITIVADTVFASLQGNGKIKGRASNGVVTGGATYTAGDVLYGDFHQLQLTSGHVRCYFA